MVDSFHAGAMRSKQIRDSELFQLVAGPVQLLVGRRKQMQPADYASAGYGQALCPKSYSSASGSIEIFFSPLARFSQYFFTQAS